MNAATRGGVSPWAVAMAVSLATFMEVLDTTITNVSITHIGGSLAASRDESTWVLTSYLVANGIVLPISGWLSDRIGRKKYFLACIATFTAASFACGAATSLGMLIAFRLIQGLAGGGLQPTQQSIILDAFPPEKRGAAFGVTGITLIAAPVIGPTLGGWITDNYSWRWIFFINVPVGIAACLLVYNLVAETAAKGGKGRIDFIGLGLVALGLASLQIVLDKGEEDDWFSSPFICFFSVLAAVGIGSALVWLLRQKDPIIELGLLKTRSFATACLLIFFMGFALYGGSLLLPQLVQTQLGYTATLAGLVLSPGGLAVIVLMPIAGRLVSKVPARNMIMFGFFLCGLGMLYTSYFAPDVDYETLVKMRILQVLGLPFLFIPISSVAFADIPKEKNNKASALYALSRNLGGSVGISLVTTLETRRAQMHQTYLSAHLSASDLEYRQSLADRTRELVMHGVDPGSAAAQATGRMYMMLQQQAAFLSYADCFRILFVLMWSVAFLALLLPDKVKKGTAPAGAH